MMEPSGVLGGEEAGGFAIRGHIPERDGILAGLFFADMIVKEDKPLSDILSTPEPEGEGGKPFEPDPPPLGGGGRPPSLPPPRHPDAARNLRGGPAAGDGNS